MIIRNTILWRRENRREDVTSLATAGAGVLTSVTLLL
jgi:hypothetical protein